MPNILASLKKLTTSSDFAAALTELEREHAAALAAVGELEAGREAAIFSGGDLVKLASDISAAEGSAKTLAIAITGATKRRAEAVEAEATAALEAVAAKAGKLTKTLRAGLISFEKSAEELAGHAETVTSLRREIAVHNTTLREANRADLAATDPIKQQARDADRQITEPLAGLVIAGHWPHTRPKTLKLATAG